MTSKGSKQDQAAFNRIPQKLEMKFRLQIPDFTDLFKITNNLY